MKSTLTREHNCCLQYRMTIISLLYQNSNSIPGLPNSLLTCINTHIIQYNNSFGFLLINVTLKFEGRDGSAQSCRFTKHLSQFQTKVSTLEYSQELNYLSNINNYITFSIQYNNPYNLCRVCLPSSNISVDTVSKLHFVCSIKSIHNLIKNKL